MSDCQDENIEYYEDIINTAKKKLKVLQIIFKKRLSMIIKSQLNAYWSKISYLLRQLNQKGLTISIELHGLAILQMKYEVV